MHRIKYIEYNAIHVYIVHNAWHKKGQQLSQLGAILRFLNNPFPELFLNFSFLLNCFKYLPSPPSIILKYLPLLICYKIFHLCQLFLNISPSPQFLKSCSQNNANFTVAAAGNFTTFKQGEFQLCKVTSAGIVADFIWLDRIGQEIELRNVIQVPQHLTHILNSCIITNSLTIMSTFQLVHTRVSHFA